MRDITIGSSQLRLDWFTGSVAEARVARTTQVTGGGGGGYSDQHGGYRQAVHVSSMTTVHDQLFLVDHEGTERSFELANFNLACRESNVVTVMWVAWGGTQRGPFVLVYNHTTGEAKYGDAAIGNLVGPSRIKYWLWGALGTVLAFKFLFILAALFWFIVIIGVGVVIFNLRTGQRVDAFKRSRDVQEIIAGIDTTAKATANRGRSSGSG